MKNILLRMAAIVAILFGLMALFMGTRVLSGYLDPGYNTIAWLIYYNVIMGAVSLYTGFLIWKENAKTLLFSGIVSAGHITVLLFLLTIFNSVVASQSIKAMSIRSVVWGVIFLIVFKFKQNK